MKTTFMNKKLIATFTFKTYVLNYKRARLPQHMTGLVYTTENANFTVYNPALKFVLFSFKLYIFNAVHNFFIMVLLS